MLVIYVGAFRVGFPVHLSPPPNENGAELVVESVAANELLPDSYAINPYKSRFEVIKPQADGKK
jgi:hypothetical protein